MVRERADSAAGRPLHRRAAQQVAAGRDATDPLDPARGRAAGKSGDELCLVQADLRCPGRIRDPHDERAFLARDGDRPCPIRTEGLASHGSPGVYGRHPRDAGLEAEPSEGTLDRTSKRPHARTLPSDTRNTAARSSRRSGTPASNAAVTKAWTPSGTESTSASRRGASSSLRTSSRR